MRILFFGAGPLGSLYTHLLHESGKDVTLLARGERRDWIQRNGLSLKNEITGESRTSRVDLVSELKPGDAYDLVVVLIRKNKLPPVFEILAGNSGVENILFMGNNALGFDEYVAALPAEKLLFGFPGAGGGVRDQVVHYADRDRPDGRRRAITIGEMDGRSRDRTRAIQSLFESAGVPVDLTASIDGWLKYHVALVSPLAGALYQHRGDPRRASRDTETLRALVRAAKEGGRVLRELGFRKRQPFSFNLFYWLPEAMSMKAVRTLLEGKFAEVAFAMHAESARDEMRTLAREFQQLTARTSIHTPNLNRLTSFTD